LALFKAFVDLSNLSFPYLYSMNLITGCTGLLGGHVALDLLKKGEKVRAIKRPGSDFTCINNVFNAHSKEDVALFEKIEWVEGDVLDIYSLIEAMDGINHLYHCAALVSFDPRDKDKMWKVNVEGTANVMNAALDQGIKKVCHVSSIAALGSSPETKILTEDSWWKDAPENSWYAVTKYTSEREAWRAIEEGLNVVIVNPSIILGPGDKSKGSTAIFSAGKKGLKFYPTGGSGFVDARDVSRCMIELMQGNFCNDRYIINAENISYKDLFSLIHKSFGLAAPTYKAGKLITGFLWRAETLRSFITGKPPVLTKETAIAVTNTREFSNKKVRDVLGIPFIPLENSVKDICEWYLKKE
jgi:dihydroflavonol-4-reductase